MQIRDNAGNIVGSEMLTLAQDEKTVFVLAEKYPATASTARSSSPGTDLGVMGLRFNPGGSFTSSHALTMH